MSSLEYWVWLSELSGVGAVTAARLLRHFGAPEKIFSADPSEYGAVEGITRADISKLIKKDTGPADKILSSCAETGCRVVTLQDAEYPDRLKNIYDPPIVLYIRGNLHGVDDDPAVAIVGTRNCTPYGLSAAESTAYSLARRGLTIVTGLARGVDSAAARGALRGGGRVIGVIGSGTDVVYPPENRLLFEDVAGFGAVISEYPPGSLPIAAHFPARNRIISGLSIGITVIEAPKKSGALITAARALEQGRDVFVLPANVGARSSEGSNSLLREGAIPVLSPDDIAEEYAALYPDKILPKGQQPQETRWSADDGARYESLDSGKKEVDIGNNAGYICLDKILSELTGDEKDVAESIGGESAYVDEIISRTCLPAQRVSTALTMLEIKGIVTRSSGQWSVVDGGFS